jgi:hypothetical protein
VVGRHVVRPRVRIHDSVPNCEPDDPVRHNEQKKDTNGIERKTDHTSEATAGKRVWVGVCHVGENGADEADHGGVVEENADHAPRRV